MFSLSGNKFRNFLAIFGMVLLVAGVYITFFQSRGFAQTTGTIVDIEEDEINDDTVYWGTVEYSVDGISYSGRADEAVNSDSMGKEVTVLYNPDNPAVFHIKGRMGTYAMIVGAVLVIISVVFRFRRNSGNV